MAYKLLICEDEAIEREAIALIINRARLPMEIVGEAENGLEAVRMAARTKPDIVLMDIKMPGLDGLAAAAQIREKDGKCKIVIITAYDEFDYAQEALRLGAVDYLLKPVRPEELVTVMQKLINTLEKEKEKTHREEELRQSIQKAIKFLRAGFFCGLLLGAFEEQQAIKVQADILGLKQVPQGVLVIAPDVAAADAASEFDRYEVYRLIEQLMAPYENSIVVLLGEDIVVGAGLERDLKELGESLRSAVEETLEFSVTIGIGRVTSSGDLPRLFREAQMAARLGRFYLGGNRVVMLEEIGALMPQQDYSDFEREEQLLEQVRLGQKAEAAKTFEILLQEMLARGYDSLTYCQMRLAEILVLLWRTARQAGYVGRNEFHLQQSYLQRLWRCQTPVELSQWGQNLLEEILVPPDKGHTPKELVRQIVKYIHDHYAKELTLQDIARQIYLSPDYFSRLFKKEVGCTYAEYLTKVRVERAKALLSNPALSVAEVAQKVGYHDPNYFSRVFRKVVGVSPSDYRQALGL